MNKKKIISIDVSTGSYKEFIDGIMEFSEQGESKYTCVANVHMLVEAYSDKNFSDIVTNADVTTPDGKPLTWAMNLIHGVKQDRVAGMDLVPDLLEEATRRQIPVYFYGGTEDLMQPALEYLQNKYTRLLVAGYYCPPFRPLTHLEERVEIKKINNSGAGLVFVILGCPKQEKWMAAMKGSVNAMMIGVGGAFPVFAGAKKRAPKWMQDYGLEWFFRLGQEPGRLFRRYAVTNSLFVCLLVREFFHSRFVKVPLKAESEIKVNKNENYCITE